MRTARRHSLPWLGAGAFTTAQLFTHSRGLVTNHFLLSHDLYLQIQPSVSSNPEIVSTLMLVAQLPLPAA